ncbi:MAG: hypothetical protein VKK42_20090 [Lyngbya sp.]|nr:hypothetical protein [Lyngbya sp.]
MVSTPEENQAQIISESEDGGDISLEELANTNGNDNREPESDAEILLGMSGENRHPVRKESPPDVTKNPVLKTLFQAGLIGVVVLLASLMWMALGHKGEQEVATPTEEEVADEQARKIKELEDALYRERAQVAVRNLQSPLPDGSQSKGKPAPSPQAKAEEKPTPQPATPPPQPTATASRPSPPPPPRRVSPPVTRTLPVQVASARRSPNISPVQSPPPSPPATQPSPSPTTPKEEFDDLSLWGELAALGQVQQTNFQPRNNPEQTQPQLTEGIETAEFPTDEIPNSHIASVLVGNEPIPQPQNLSQVQDGLTPGMRGILNQTSEYANPNSKEVQVAIGTTAQGKVVVPLHWNQEIDGTDGMFLVELTEPLIAEDGTPALEKGTQLIVSVSFISDAGQVFQSVMAVVHPDGRQETIPVTGSGYNDAPVTPLILRGKRGDVLIAEKIEGTKTGPGMGSDLAVSLVAGIAEAADNITQPSQQVQTQTTGLSSTSTSQQNRQEPEAAFIKGLTETLTERMTARLDAEPQELKIFQVDRGERVLLFVNGFVTFRVPTGRG